MTVSTTIAKSGPYAGAGTSGPFLVNFRFLQDNHLKVIRTAPSGAYLVLTLGTQYTVSGAGNPTGSVTLVGVLQPGWTLTILRDVPATQEADYVQNDAFPAESHEKALDKLTMIVQQQGESLSRALVVPESDTAPSLVLPIVANRSGRYLSFDEQGNPVATTFNVGDVEEASQAAIAAAAAAAISEVNAAASATSAEASADHAQDLANLVGQQVAAATPSVVRFSGTGAQTEFVLPGIPGSENNTQVYIDGVYQQKDTYEVVSNTLIFSSAPPDGANNIEVVIAPSVQIMTGSADNIAYGERTLTSRLNDRLHIADFTSFAVPGNWAPAITAALTAANGRDLYFESGVTYPISQAIVYNGNVSIKTTGSGQATIFHNGQSFTPLSIIGSATGKVCNLTSDMQINNTGWVVDDAAGVQIGMLAEVKSSASWYHDPRPESSDGRKSELHKVAKIIGNTIYMEDVANDGYDLTSETVQITFYNPVNVRIDNLKIQCTLAPFSESAPWVNGVEVRYGADVQIDNCDISEAAGRGMFFNECYRVHVRGGSILKANNQGLGYGVQTYGASHVTITGVKFYENRKCVDWSGGQIVSRYLVVEECSAFGGGFNSQGEAYNWADNGLNGSVQVGFGGHGVADHCIFRNNIIVNMRYGINSLSRNVIIEGNYFVGRSSYGIYIDQGENAWVRNNIVYDGWSNLKDGAIHSGFASQANYRMIAFLRMGQNWMGGRLYVNDNEMQINGSMISFQNTTNGCKLTAKGNTVDFYVPVNGTQVYMVLLSGATETVTDWDIHGNILTLKGFNAPLPELLGGITLGARTTLVQGSINSGRYTATVTPAANMTEVTNVTQPYHYMRIGDIVQVTGSFSFTAGTIGSMSSALVTLPFPPNNDFAAADQAFGVVSANAVGFGYCSAAPPNRVRVFFNSQVSTSPKVEFSFTYRM